MKLWIALFVIVVVAAVPLLAAKGDAAAGKALFAKSCASCHGPDGAGKDAIAKMFKVTMRHLGSKDVQAKTDDTLLKNITEGNGKMKPIKLTAEEAANVIAHLRTLKQ
jgi:mono/diheme cytochrome c family protein